MNQETYKRFKIAAICFLLLLSVLIGGIQYKKQNSEHLDIQFYELNPEEVQSADLTANERSTKPQEENPEDNNTAADTPSYTPEEAWTININTASSEELQKLYGIGPALAERIVQYRDTYGSYETIEEIMEVNGIGEVTYEKIKEWIRVQND